MHKNDATSHRRETERKARLAWILDNAISLLQEEGLQGFSTPKLAGMLGYTSSALYRYFPSRDALLGALQVGIIGAFFDMMEMGVKSIAAKPALVSLPPKTNALAHLLILGRLYQEITKKHPAQFRLISQMLTQNQTWLTPEDSRRISEMVAPSLMGVLIYFEQAQRIGALRSGPAKDRAVGAWASWQGVLSAASIQRFNAEVYDPELVEESVLKGLLIGWGAPEDLLAEAWDVVETMRHEGPFLKDEDLAQMAWWQRITQMTKNKN